MTIEASLDEVEDMLMSRSPQQVIIAELVLNFIEKQFVLDYQYYRILSLTPFIRPEFFSSNWIKPHLDYIFNYFRANELGFTNVPTAPFSTIAGQLTPTQLPIPSRLENDSLSSIMTQNLSLYNVLRQTIKDDYKIYVFEDLIPIRQNQANYNVKFKIISDEELSTGGQITEDIASSLMVFYQYSIVLRMSYDYKEIALFNLQKLSNLQMQSYETLLRDIDRQISIYGF